MRTVCAVTVGRSDYGIFRPVLRAIRAHAALRLRLVVAGMHLDPAFGHTVDEIEAEGMPIADRVELSLAGDTPLAVASSMGLGVLGFGQLLARARPDVLLLLGDRYEMYAAAAAAAPFPLAVAHIHGGELTLGAMDDALRHSITKLAHLHFPSTERHARRLLQLGEEPWRITVAGAPALDQLADLELADDAELRAALGGLRLEPAPLVVTVHPETRGEADPDALVDALVGGLDGLPRDGAGDARPVVFTAPNADPGGRRIAARLAAHAAGRPRTVYVQHLGSRRYFALLARAAAMVGNSSSGIVEAASFALPVVDVGDREAGRSRGRNVLHADVDPGAITAALERALSPAFRASLRGMTNPYGDGRAAERIVRRLADVPLDARLLRKGFVDLDVPAPPAWGAEAAR